MCQHNLTNDTWNEYRNAGWVTRKEISSQKKKILLSLKHSGASDVVLGIWLLQGPGHLPLYHIIPKREFWTGLNLI